jgi:RimJ/RimL family protein N-acetyltransferase
MISLRPWANGDLPLLYRANEPQMTEHLGGPETEQQVIDRHVKYLRMWREGTARWFAIELDGEPVGGIGWWDSEWDAQPVHETGWFVVPEAQGKGVARGAVPLLIADVRDHGRLAMLTAYPSVQNVASNALCDSAGFRLIGEDEAPFRGMTLVFNVWGLDLG